VKRRERSRRTGRKKMRKKTVMKKRRSWLLI